MIEWQAAAIILEVKPYGEAAAIVSVFTEEHGICRAFVRGAGSAKQRGIWQQGNVIRVRFRARLSEQLGSLSGELIRPVAAFCLEERLFLNLLSAATAVLAKSVAEQNPHPFLFHRLLHLLAGLSEGKEAPVAEFVRWEKDLLRELGFGLDFSCCALSGRREHLAYVSPKTGRAVNLEAAGVWASRLLRLPAFFLDETDKGTPADWEAGLKITGSFLIREVFMPLGKPLPLPRLMLYDHVCRVAREQRLSEQSSETPLKAVKIS